MEPWRRLALYLLVFGTVGVSAELLLLEHFEDSAQWIPLALLGVGLIAALAVALRPGPRLVRALRGVMLLFVLSGVAGIYFHLKANVEFELELRPSMAGGELVIESLKGAMPALAPGTMVQLGLLGLLVCYRHPALRDRAKQTG
jgi:hypothetical protein